MNKTLKRITAIVQVLLCLVGITACTPKEPTQKVNLYYLDEAGTILEAETREIPKTAHLTDTVGIVMAELLKGPESEFLHSPFPEGVSVNSLNINNRMVTLDFNSKFVFKKESEALFARTSLVRTLCDLSGIDRVKVTVAGKPLTSVDGTKIGILQKSDIIDDSELVVADYKAVVLYFASADGQHLVPEYRTVIVNAKESLENVLVNELIKGPENDHLSKTIPQETKVLSIETKEGICFVNLSKEFKTAHPGGSMEETMTIYSIVNTLTGLPNVQKVQFLIEGQKEEEYIHFVFNEPFLPDKALIKQ
ncbi:MAG: GerMN domain-containing protein [Clostridia bacterium]|nr:GerMN domain-containing protein [Clostridia bacterium]